MAEIRRIDGSDGFDKSNVIVACHKQSVGGGQCSDADDNGRESVQKMNDGVSETKTVRQYYIDELGFYRHLDNDRLQYVCSNISASNLRRALRDENKQNPSGETHKICFRAMRNELGISHFDRTLGYNEWKQSWDKFMRSKLMNQEPVTLNNGLKLLVRTGIPTDYRVKVWRALINMRTRHIRAQTGDDIYENILKYMSKYHVLDYTSDEQINNENLASRRQSVPSPEVGVDALASLTGHEAKSQKPPVVKSSPQKNRKKMSRGPQKFFRQIELDLLRTLPNNRHFEDPNSRGIHRLRRVLRAFACFNPKVGYTQGLNRLAATFLLILPEADAFWGLICIIQCIQPKDFYLKPWLAQVDCCVLADLLERKMPKLHKHLVKNDIQLTLFSWFFTIFVDGFRPELTLRIWDCFLLEGDKVLFRFALAVLYICQEDLLKMHEFSNMSTHLSCLVSSSKLNTEHLFEIAFNTMNPLSGGTIQSRRDYHRQRMQNDLEN